MNPGRQRGRQVRRVDAKASGREAAAIQGVVSGGLGKPRTSWAMFCTAYSLFTSLIGRLSPDAPRAVSRTWTGSPVSRSRMQHCWKRHRNVAGSEPQPHQTQQWVVFVLISMWRRFSKRTWQTFLARATSRQITVFLYLRHESRFSEISSYRTGMQFAVSAVAPGVISWPPPEDGERSAGYVALHSEWLLQMQHIYKRVNSAGLAVT